MLSELDVLKEVSGRLETAGIAYMLTGSVAMNYYAERPTPIGNICGTGPAVSASPACLRNA